MATECQVIVIGGGPAGSTAAAVLAAAGVDVVVLEQDTFPRFHIGESLLPKSLEVLQRIGVDLGDGRHQLKAGARFRDEVTGQAQLYRFAESLPGPPRFAYQVERALFDRQLLERAQALGARVKHGERVEEVELSDTGVVARTAAGSWSARYLVDATGQQAFLARRSRTVQPLQVFGRAASFCHFHELNAAVRAQIEPEGNIEVLRVDGGWAWAIPLSGGRLSVGLVQRGGKLRPDAVLAAVESSPLLRTMTAGAARTEPTLIGDYSFRNTRPNGARFVCVGDCACFLDPVFSSGVTLALVGASMAMDRLVEALRSGGEGDPDLMTPWTASMHPAYKGFFSLIYRFYNTAILDNLFFAQEQERDYRIGLTTMLAGDVWRSDNRFQDMLLASVRHLLVEQFA
jgi:flavin-dependent dehydrogenase